MLLSFDGKGLPSCLIHHASCRAAGVHPLATVSSEIRAAASETRLECLLAGSEALGSAKDYRNLFAAYVTTLIHNGRLASLSCIKIQGSTEKLRELAMNVRNVGGLLGGVPKVELRSVLENALQSNPTLKTALESSLSRGFL